METNDLEAFFLWVQDKVRSFHKTDIFAQYTSSNSMLRLGQGKSRVQGPRSHEKKFVRGMSKKYSWMGRLDGSVG